MIERKKDESRKPKTHNTAPPTEWLENIYGTAEQ